MDSRTSVRKKLPVVPILAASAIVLVLIAGLVYLNRPTPKGSDEGTASAEAKAYLPNLELIGVEMKATENFMQQRVVEIEGKISNKGSRPLRSIDVYCIFSDVNGQAIYRERSAIVRSTGSGPLAPHEIRPFRLPFDSLPDGWNQALPRLVIAQITFAQ